MQRVLFSVLCLLGVSACVSSTSSPYTEASAICDNAGLESQLTLLRDKSRSSRMALAQAGGNRTGGNAGFAGFESSRADVERAYVLRNRLNQFEAEVDAQFRNVTSTCKAYSRCMEMNGYKTSKCGPLLSRWEDAEDEFSDLTTEIRRIDAEVEKMGILAEALSKKGRKGKKRYDVNRHDPCTCEDSVGGVFANCCSN